ncbi:MAG: hypothetical protein AAB597_02425 [Patescibacteria group bacterium]
MMRILSMVFGALIGAAIGLAAAAPAEAGTFLKVKKEVSVCALTPKGMSCPKTWTHHQVKNNMAKLGKNPQSWKVGDKFTCQVNRAWPMGFQRTTIKYCTKIA